MELNAFFFINSLFIFTGKREREKLSADYGGGQQVDKICHIFTSSLMLCLFLLPFFHTHTQKPINFYEPNKSGSRGDGHTDKHADLAPFFIYLYIYIFALSPLVITLPALVPSIKPSLSLSSSTLPPHPTVTPAWFSVALTHSPALSLLLMSHVAVPSTPPC